MNTVAQCINIAAGKTLINKLQIPISKIIIPTTYPKHTPAGLTGYSVLTKTNKHTTKQR